MVTVNILLWIVLAANLEQAHLVPVETGHLASAYCAGLGRVVAQRSGIPRKRAGRLVSILCGYAWRFRIDPYLAAALIQRESQWRVSAYSDGNYGLGQVRVSKTVNAHLLGREHVLYDPKVNIRYTVKMLSWWRRWHRDHCGVRSEHWWWGHYQWGRRVKSAGSGDRVHHEYLRLLAVGSQFSPHVRRMRKVAW